MCVWVPHRKWFTVSGKRIGFTLGVAITINEHYNRQLQATNSHNPEILMLVLGRSVQSTQLHTTKSMLTPACLTITSLRDTHLLTPATYENHGKDYLYPCVRCIGRTAVTPPSCKGTVPWLRIKPMPS